MRLGVVTQAPPLNQLPQQLLTHLVHHSPDVFYKRGRPYAKLTLPPSYTENQALCQQFGISPHSILCMEPALWRQQIVDQVMFDLSESLIQIDFIDGLRSVYSFKTPERTLPTSTTIPSSRDPSVGEQITTALVSQLDPLHSLHQRGAEFVADLSQLCLLPSQELAMLMAKLRPYPLTPTPRQVALDERRARQRTGIPVSIKKKPTRRKRSSSLGTPRPRHQTKSAPTPNIQPSDPPLARLTSTFRLPEEDLYQCILHLTRYRATLVDLFQSVVLALLRVELPALYSLWILQSQIRSLQEFFTNCAAELTHILNENDAPSLFQRLHSSAEESDSLGELRLWCEAATASMDTSFRGETMGQDASSFGQPLSSGTPELMFSANTSFNEPSSSQTGDHMSTSESSLDNSAAFPSTLHGEPASKSQKSLPQHIPTTLPWRGLSSSIDTTEHRPLDNPQSDSRCSHHTHTPLSPSPPPCDGLGRPTQPNLTKRTIFRVPLLLLEQDLLEAIGPKGQKERAVELVIQIAEARLEIEQLEENSRILKLLEEERESREQFSGISRLSDIITTARLSLGMEGNEGDIGRHVRIRAALKQAHQHDLNNPCHANPKDRAPSKASEMRRQQAVKRKAWSATTRRLDRPWINQGEDQLAHQALSVWPEPIFLKTSHPPHLKRKRHDDPRDSNPGPHSPLLDPFAGPPQRVDSCFVPSLPPATPSPNNPPKSSRSIGDLRKILLNL